MSCLGVHFALSPEEADHLRSLRDDEARINHIQSVIEEHYFVNAPGLKAESDKSWDAMHRALSDGELSSSGGTYPLNHVVLGGENLYAQDDYIVFLKSPQQVRDAAAVLVDLTEAEFRRRYFAIDPDSYGMDLTEEDFSYTWGWFQDVRKLFQRASAENRSVLFTADQ